MINHLPHELLISIFYIATYNTIRDPEYLADSPHFAFLKEKEDDKLNDESLEIKVAISSVCWLWRDLNLKFMYEDIIIRHGAQMLADVLENGIQMSMGRTRRLGHFVRRIQLSTMYGVASKTVLPNMRIMHVPWFDVIGRHTARMFRSCPNTIHLDRRRDLFCRPSDFKQQFFRPNNVSAISDFQDIQFLNMSRIDWDGGRSLISTLDSYLMPCFATLQSLRTLALSGLCWKTDWKLMSPHLKTIHMNGAYSRIVKDEAVIPSFSRVVICTTLCPNHPLMLANYRHVRTIEIGRIQKLDTEKGGRVLARLLLSCPNLEELFYPIFFIMLRQVALSIETPLANLKTLGLHSVPNPKLNRLDLIHYMIDHHFSALCDPQSPFKAIEKILLLGDGWGRFRGLEGFQDVESLVQARKIILA